MAKTKRWGDSYFDRRDWHTYDHQLVKGGEFFIDLNFVKHWEQKLATMNSGKRGAPYLFPNSLIELQAVWRGVATATPELCNTASKYNLTINFKPRQLLR